MSSFGIYLATTAVPPTSIQLDLDGDGTDEIVLEVRGYESEELQIYRRQHGIWNLVHVGGRGGC
jgi:hypothetical protein